MTRIASNGQIQRQTDRAPVSVPHPCFRSGWISGCGWRKLPDVPVGVEIAMRVFTLIHTYQSRIASATFRHTNVRSSALSRSCLLSGENAIRAPGHLSDLSAIGGVPEPNQAVASSGRQQLAVG